MAISAINQMQTLQQPLEPYTWRKGGVRMTPEQLARERQLAQIQIQQGADYSPVGHWTQGLSRVAQALVGNLRQDRVEKAEQENMDANARIAQLLIDPTRTPGTVGAVLTDPYANEQNRGLAQMIWERQNPKAQAPTEFDRALVASGIQPGTPAWTEAYKTFVQNKLDPWTNIVSGGNSYTGRQSLVEQALNGGGGGTAPIQAVPTAPVGKLTPIAGGPTQPASAGFPPDRSGKY